MRFKIFGTEIYLSFLFAAVITIMLATDRTGFLLFTFFAVFLHETGHLFMMWLLDCTPKRIKLIPTSVQIVTDFSRGYKNDIKVALAGPAVNILMFATFYYNYLRYGTEISLNFALINLLIALFNLLPVKGLDGGSVLFGAVCKFYDINKATKILKTVTFFAAAGIIISAVWLTAKGKINISLYIMGIYFLIIGLLKT